MLRRTKIVVTLGPALAGEEKIKQAILAGADVFRANFSHGSIKSHEEQIAEIRSVAKEIGREVAVIVDLQGPKIRIAGFANSQVTLVRGQNFTIDITLADNQGSNEVVGCDYKELIQDVIPGDVLLLDDGRLSLSVLKVEKNAVFCEVLQGGVLSGHKGINRQGGGLSAPALTLKDREDIRHAVRFGVDYIAVSFPRKPEDLLDARRELDLAGGQLIGVIAKMERTEAVQVMDEMILACDAVMVARGDLAVEIGDAEVPAVQKKIIQRARALNKIAITATQMMESMIHSPIPTRAEVSDVANAVLDGTDAVMLSAETAVGDYPIESIVAMNRVCLSAEKNPITKRSRHRMNSHFERVDEAIAMASMYVANHLDIAAIACLTESGTTPLLMSRIRSGINIFALTRQLGTARKLNLVRGVYPILFDSTKIDQDCLDEAITKLLLSKKVLHEGESIIVTRGDKMGVHGLTNLMKIHTL